MNIIIIGGSGFIGTRLISSLIGNEDDVIKIIDKTVSNNYPDLHVRADVRNYDEIYSNINNGDVIVNLAAEHKDNVSPASLYYDVNVTGAENICKAATEAGVRKIIFTSSVALYGLNKHDSVESDQPDPFNDYGKSKLMAEEVFINWANSSEENELIIIRPVVIFGENNRGNVYNLLKQIASGRFFMIGRGRNSKSMGYVGNIAAFIQYCIAHKFDEKITIINYADKPDMNMNKLVETTNRALSIDSKVRVRIPYWLGIAAASMLDVISKISGKEFPVSTVRIKKFCADTIVNADKLDSTGFQRPYTLEEGLERTIKHEFLSVHDK